jgi:beta-xylosidase
MTEVGTLANPAPADETGLGQADDMRVHELLGRMTLAEKLAQIVGFWDKGEGEAVAPMQGQFGADTDLNAFAQNGLGHLTRAYGTRPVDAGTRAAWLWDFQRKLVTNTRLGIPAIVHEECLTGLSVWKAATFPTPLAWARPSTRRWWPRWGRRSAGPCGRWASTRAWPPSLT